MTLKKRLGKLEPALEKAWVKAWEEALIPPELAHFEYKAEHMSERLRSMSQDELAALDERFQADQEQYPALKAWNDPSFAEWLETFAHWHESSGLDFGNPDFTLWPHQVPEPPEIPEEVIADLKRGAGTWGELTNLYAYWLLEVGMALGISRAIAKHEARADNGQTSTLP